MKLAVATACTTALLLPVFAQEAAALESSSDTPMAEAPASAEDAATDGDRATSTWTFDPAHTTIGFRIDHMGLVDVIGRFHDFTGTILANTDDPSASSVEFTAQVASVDTGVEDRDNHLQQADFFDAENHPEITFQSSSVEAVEGGYSVTGDLTMRGETREVTIPLEVTGPIEGMQGEQRIGAQGQVTVDRTEFGIDYGTEMIGTDVVVDLQVEAVEETPASSETE